MATYNKRGYKPPKPEVEKEENEALNGTSEDRKSTRLNSSHVRISYAVFCLKKKKERRHGRGDVAQGRREAEAVEHLADGGCLFESEHRRAVVVQPLQAVFVDRHLCGADGDI